MTVTLPERSGKSAPVQTAPALAARPPQFVIQSTWPCHFKVVPVAPTANGRSVDGVDYADFGAAKAVRDRLNAEAAL